MREHPLPVQLSCSRNAKNYSLRNRPPFVYSRPSPPHSSEQMTEHSSGAESTSRGTTPRSHKDCEALAQQNYTLERRVNFSNVPFCAHEPSRQTSPAPGSPRSAAFAILGVEERAEFSDLEPEALALLQQWVFTPAMCNGHPNPTPASFTLHFQGR